MMLSDTDLRKMERKAYLSYHQDGLIDILIGLFILSFGIDMALEASFTPFLSWIPIILYLPLKRLITYPRTGYVKFSPERQAKEKKKWVALVALGFVPLTLGVVVFLALSGRKSFSPGSVDWLREYSLFLFGVMLALCSSVGGLLSGVKRLYAYAVLILAAFAVGHLLKISPHLYVTSLGAIILLSGVVVLIRFLRKYPRSTEEVSHGKGN